MSFRLGRALRRFFTVTEPEDQDRHVGYAKSSADCFWCDSTIRPGEMVLYYGEPPAQVPRTRKPVIFHYSCAMTLDLYEDHSSSLTLYANLKERLEAQEKIKELLLKDSPNLEAPGVTAKKEDLGKEGVIMIEMVEVIVLLQVLQRLAKEYDGKKTIGIIKFITQLENAPFPLAEFMAPVLEKESRNPLLLADILVALSEEGHHDSVVIEMVKDALARTLKTLGWLDRIPLTTAVIAPLEEINDPMVISRINAILERAIGKKDSPVIAAVNAQLQRQSRS